jgi:uncharacterized damage-inducible protein DinB
MLTTPRHILRYQIDYSKWATDRVLAAAAKLTPEELVQDFKTSDKSVLGTLIHCYRAERIWLNRLQNKKVDFKVDGDDTFTALQQSWPSIQAGWSDWARLLTEDSASSECSYSDLKGNVWNQPIWMVVLHVVNHSTHHRGQAVGFIRALGHVPPNVDLVTFSRERM